jgi:hypothetical protein
LDERKKSFGIEDIVHPRLRNNSGTEEGFVVSKTRSVLCVNEEMGKKSEVITQ